MPRVIITVPGASPQPYLFPLERKSVTLGRGSVNDIVMDCPSVSVRHAEMKRLEGGYEMRDLASTNGIKVHGEPRAVVVLHDGDTLKLGDVGFQFTLSDEEKEILGRERPLEEYPIIREPVIEPETPVLEEPEIALDAGAEIEQEADEPAPKPRPETSAGSLPQASQYGCAWWFWMLVVAVIAFCAGMAVRHERGTGESWLKSVKERLVPSPPKSPPPPAP